MMRYEDELTRLLLPLGVYSFAEGSYSLGELQALGAALDALYAHAREGHRESIVMTAEDDGLARMEALFRYRAAAQDAASRRAAIAGFLQISGDSFTAEALSRCLSACGAACLVEEVGVNRVKVSFPYTMGVPEGFARMKIIIEDILPCQLEIEYWFRYCTWGETEAYGLRWSDLGKLTWHGWRVYRE